MVIVKYVVMLGHELTFAFSSFNGGEKKKVCRDQDSNLGYRGHNARS